MPVLITSGLSPEAWRLNRVLDNPEVLFADESQLPNVPGMKSVVLPPYHSASYIHETLKACLDHDIDRVYPLKWGEVRELAKARALYSEYNIRLMIPSDSWLENRQEPAVINTANIAVIEDGILIAGDAPKEGILLTGETGIFSWATQSDEIQYSLYII